MLQDQTLSISFNKGLNTKADPKQIMPGELLTLQNGIFIAVNEILKRNGYVPLSTDIFPSGSISKGVAMGVFNNNDLLVLDGASAYSYSPTRDEFGFQGLKSQLNIVQTPILSNAGALPAGEFTFFPAIVPDVSGIELTTFVAQSVGTQRTVQYVYLDNLNKTQILAGTTIAAAANITITSNELHLLTTPGAPIRQWVGVNQVENTSTLTANLYATTYGQPGVANGTLTLLTPVRYTPAVPAPQTPSVSVTSPTHLYVLYQNVAEDTILARFDNTLTLVNSTTIVTTDPEIQYTSLQYDSTNDNLIVGYCKGNSPGIDGQVFFAAYSSSLATVVAPMAVTGALEVALSSTATVSGTTLALFVEMQHVSLGQNRFIRAIIISNYTTTPVVTQQLDIGHFTVLHSSAFTRNGSFYVPVTFRGWTTANGQIGQTYFILEVTSDGTDSVAGKYAYLTANPLGTGIGTTNINRTVVTGDGSIIISFYKAINNGVGSGIVIPIYNLQELKVTFDFVFQTVPLGLNLNISGSVASLYDGRGIAEVGYNVPGGFTTNPVLTVGPGSIAPGTYLYYVVYEWTDLQGNIHRSSPGVGRTVVVAAPSTRVTLNLPYLGLSEPYKRKAVVVTVYRTQNGGTIPYRVGTAFNYTGVASGQVTVVDDASDSAIAGNQQLYTVGGEVDNTAPSGLVSMTSFKNRLIGISIEDPLIWWYSKQVIQGFPVEFSDLFTQAIDQRGGPITAVATMDDKLIFFKEYNIFYVTGDGPAPSGANNDFSYPQIITTDSVGCVDPKSIVLIPNGLLFKSHKGIYLLDRGLGCSYIGANVESFNQYTIVSSCVVPETTQARLTLSNGSILVYDYLAGQWSEFTNLLSVDSIVYNNKYTLLSPTGIVTQETSGVYTDSGAAISLSLKTGWFSFGNLQGFQRIKEFLILGESESNTSLTVSLSHNFLPTINQTDVIPITANARLQYRIFPQRQKCESMQITISDSPSAPLGEGLRLSALGFNIGVKKGLNKVPASQNYG